ncbi:MAG: class I SAM-dependent DNA methyltransferase [Acidobacteriota bacterium]
MLRGAEKSKRGDAPGLDQIVSSRVKEVCVRNLFGLDINPFLVRTCQMNLVMHGDGSANVFQANSAWSPSEWDDPEASKRLKYNKADIVITNPPFGGKAMTDDPHVLSRYQLAAFDVKNVRNVLPAEQLFVEASLNFLRPGGILAIVLPDSILNNPGLEFIRKWLLMRTRIIASVDLPKETFATSGGVPNPSVLIVQKLSQAEAKISESGSLSNYDVFMAIPKTAGIDKRGNPVYKRSPEGFNVLDDTSEPIRNDEISLVADAVFALDEPWANWIRNKRKPVLKLRLSL